MEDKDLILQNGWLNDKIIYSAQQLLKGVAPVGVGGFQSPQCGKKLQFKPLLEKFIQVLHANDTIIIMLKQGLT